VPVSLAAFARNKGGYKNGGVFFMQEQYSAPA